jgi:sugar phosphate isomerase/epimerase
MGAWASREAPFEVALELLKKEGVQYIEIGWNYWLDKGKYSLGGILPPSMIERTEAFGYKPPTREEIKRRAKKFKETLDSYCIEPIQIHAPDLDLELHTFQLENLELASWLGASVIVHHPGLLPKLANLYWEGYQTYVSKYASKVREANIKCFKELSNKAENLGVTIAIENIGYAPAEITYGASPADLLDLVDEVNSDSLGICLDTGHAFLSGFPPHEFLVRIKSKLVATHIHDNLGEAGGSEKDQHMLPLMGNIDWRAFFRAFREIGYPKPIIYEVWGGHGVGGENRLRLLRYLSEMFDNI